jgi:hypothetical protein
MRWIFLIIFSWNLYATGVMNDIRYKDFKDFDKKNSLVTVRYRKDNEEIRFTYANKIALKALKANSKNFPDGSVFGKIAYKTVEDPIFPSSVVPSTSRRMQIMVKNSKKYATTHGWGYALFDKDGNLFPENVNDQTISCNACHEIAIDRGYVFSQEINHVNITEKNANDLTRNFLVVERASLPENISKLVPSDKLNLYKGPLSYVVFQGVLDEIKPLLSKVTANSGLPTIFLSDDKKSFSLIVPENNKENCSENDKKGTYMISVWSLNKTENKSLHFCYVATI